MLGTEPRSLCMLGKCSTTDSMYACVCGGACSILGPWGGLGALKGLRGQEGCPGSGSGKLLQGQGDYVMVRAQLCLMLPSKTTAALRTQLLAPKS